MCDILIFCCIELCFSLSVRGWNLSSNDDTQIDAQTQDNQQPATSYELSNQPTVVIQSETTNKWQQIILKQPTERLEMQIEVPRRANI